MRTLKKTMCLVLALVMMLGLCAVSAVATNFTDDASISATYAEAAEVLNGIGVFKGYEDGSFKPKTEITRGEVAAILYRVVTGDVTDRQVSLYKDYNKFTDVPSSTWYAGYINFVANAELVKGHGDGNFGGDEKVTGYQVLAMMLRAVGYGKAGEFEGDGWQIQTAATAKKLGITNKIDTTTLGSNATREEVAEMIFQAIQLPQVTYSQLGGYSEYDNILGDLTGSMTKNDSLGAKSFGLAYTYGVVVGNQATGEDDTLIARAADDPTVVPTYADDFYTHGNGRAFDITTDLDWFGHAVKVWFDKRVTTSKPVYAMFDEATLVDVVEAADASIAAATDELYKAADKAGFKFNSGKTAYKDNAFAAITATRGTTADTSPIGLYALISNSSDKTLDLVIALNAQVAQIGVVDNSSTDTKTVTLTGCDFEAGGKIDQKKLTSNSTKTLGANVIVWKVAGTKDGSYYELEEMTQTVTGTVASYNTAKGTVDLTNGTTLTRSPLYSQVKSGIAQVASEAYTNRAYIFYLDNDGKYLGAEPHSDASFIYGTYADYQDAGLGTGDMTYYLTGVDLNGNKVTNTQIKNVDGTKINTAYGDLDVAKKALSGDAVVPGWYVGYTVDAGGDVSTDLSTVINQMPSASWKITSGDVKTGYFYDTATKLYLNANTKFVVVSGTGSSTLAVKTYNGVSELLGDASDVTIDGTQQTGTNDYGAIYYTRSPYYFSNVQVDAYQANVVILPEKALSYTATSNIYFIHSATTSNTDSKDDNIVQYEFYQNGEKVNLWIDTTGDNAPVADNFYKLVKSTRTTAGGEAVYTISGSNLTADTDGVIDDGTYTKTASSDWFTGTIGSTLYNLQNAKVIDLTDHKVVDEITNVAELNNAATNNESLTITVCCVLSEAKAGCTTVSYVYITSISK